MYIAGSATKEVLGTMNIIYKDTKHVGDQMHHILNQSEFKNEKKSLIQHRMEDYLLRRAGKENFNTCPYNTGRYIWKWRENIWR